MHTQTRNTSFTRIQSLVLTVLIATAIVVPVSADMEIVAVRAVEIQLVDNSAVLKPAADADALDELNDELADEFKLEIKHSLDQRLDQEMDTSANALNDQALERQLIADRL